MLVRDVLRKLHASDATLPTATHRVNDVVWVLVRGKVTRTPCYCCGGDGSFEGKDGRLYTCGSCDGSGGLRYRVPIPEEALIVRVEVAAGVPNSPGSPSIAYTTALLDTEVSPTTWDGTPLEQGLLERSALTSEDCYNILRSTDLRVLAEREVYATRELAKAVADQALLTGRADKLCHGLAVPDGERPILLTREWRLRGPVLEEGVWVWTTTLPDTMPSGALGVPFGESYHFVEPHADGYRTFTVGDAIPLYDKRHFAGSHFKHLAEDDPRVAEGRRALGGVQTRGLPA